MKTSSDPATLPLRFSRANPVHVLVTPSHLAPGGVSPATPGAAATLLRASDRQTVSRAAGHCATGVITPFCRETRRHLLDDVAQRAAASREARETSKMALGLGPVACLDMADLSLCIRIVLSAVLDNHDKVVPLMF